MYDVAQHHQQQGILQAGSGEQEQIGHAQHHAGDGVGHQGNAFDGALIPSSQSAAGCDESRTVGHQGAQSRGEQSHEQRVAVGRQQAAV